MFLNISARISILHEKLRDHMTFIDLKTTFKNEIYPHIEIKHFLVIMSLPSFFPKRIQIKYI